MQVTSRLLEKLRRQIAGAEQGRRVCPRDALDCLDCLLGTEKYYTTDVQVRTTSATGIGEAVLHLSVCV